MPRSRPARRLALGAALSTTATALCATASEPARLTLAYRAPEEAGCPDEGSFRNLVAARLGYDPFVPESQDAVRVELTRDSPRMRGHVEVARQGQGAPLARDLSGDADKCEALGAALATTLAIALDPVSALAPVSANAAQPAVAPPPPPPTPPSMLAEEPPRARPPPPAAPSPDKNRLGLYGLGGPVASILAAPTVTLGGELGAGLRYKAFSIELTGRAETTPTSVPEGSPTSYRLGATILTGGVAPCVDVGAWSACAVVRAGAFQGYSPAVTQGSPPSEPFVSAGARVGYSIALPRDLAIRPTVELAIPIVKTEPDVNDTPVWKPSALFFGAGVALLVNFL